MRFKGKGDSEEVIWATPQWRVDPTAVDEHLPQLVSPVNVERELSVAGVLLFEPSRVPIDESVAPKIDVFDHVSRSRVRIPAQLGNNDRTSWESGVPNGRIRAWWYRLLQREE